jgi:hypothetical protein
MIFSIDELTPTTHPDFAFYGTTNCHMGFVRLENGRIIGCVIKDAHGKFYTQSCAPGKPPGAWSAHTEIIGTTLVDAVNECVAEYTARLME